MLEKPGSFDFKFPNYVKRFKSKKKIIVKNASDITIPV